jgi:hypothetical protein
MVALLAIGEAMFDHHQRVRVRAQHRLSLPRMPCTVSLIGCAVRWSPAKLLNLAT